MADPAAFEAPKANPAIKWGLAGVGVLLLLALVWFVYRSMTGVHGVQVKETPPVISQLLPPPPPPPPPPPKPQEKPPEPTEKPTPQPSAEPKPNAPAPMQMNAEAQAGPGSIAAGSGTGLGTPGGTGTCLGSNCGTGGGIGDAFYGRYLSSQLQDRVEREKKLSRSAFSADFAIWISGAGAVTKVELVKGSGDNGRDDMLASVLSKVSGLDPPPASLRFPQRITVRGRRSL